MRYRLIAIDLDGTLLNEHGRVSAGNVAATRELLRRGVMVVPCTGRGWNESKQPIAAIFGALDSGEGSPQPATAAELAAAAICPGVFISGAVVADVRTGKAMDLAVIEPHLWGRLLWPGLSIAALLDPEPPSLSVVIEPSEIVLGERIVIRATVSDNQPGARVSVSIDGVPVPLVAGVAEYSPSQAGRVQVRADAVDAAGNRVSQTVDVRVLAPGDSAAPQVRIEAPLDDAAVTAPTEVFATIADDSLVRWTLYLRPGNSPTVVPIKLSEGTQNISNARIATLDPTLLFNGVYILILEAEDAAGATTSDSIQVRIDGDMKLGQFSISFVDAEVPLAGIPIRITRTYDSRQAGESLDFGHGWSVDYQNVRVRESRRLGFSWQLVQQGAGFGSWCIKPSGSPVVTVTLPDGETEQFRAKFSPECTAVVPTVYGTLVFEPVDERTQSRLEQLDFYRWVHRYRAYSAGLLAPLEGARWYLLC